MSTRRQQAIAAIDVLQRLRLSPDDRALADGHIAPLLADVRDRPHGRGTWTTARRRELADMIAAGESYATIAERMGVDRITVERQARRMGETRSRRWSADDDRQLVSMWSAGHAAGEIAQALGRTTAAVSQRAAVLRASGADLAPASDSRPPGRPRSQSPSDRQIEMRAMRDAGMSLAEIGRRMGVSRQAVHQAIGGRQA